MSTMRPATLTCSWGGVEAVVGLDQALPTVAAVGDGEATELDDLISFVGGTAAFVSQPPTSTMVSTRAS